MPHKIAPLNLPQPAYVKDGEDGSPLSIEINRRRFQILQIIDRWHIEDEWWLERPIIRHYHNLHIKDGRTIVVFKDLIDNTWWTHGG